MRPYFLPAAVCVLTVCSTSLAQNSAFIRINQVGYLASDVKIAIAFSKTPLRGDFVLRDTANRVVFRGQPRSVPAPNWGSAFTHYYELDFSSYQQPGRVALQLEESGAVSHEFSIGPYAPYQDDLLLFMRQQRCGYNPYLDMVCHMRDERSMLPFPMAVSWMPVAVGTTPAIS